MGAIGLLMTISVVGCPSPAPRPTPATAERPPAPEAKVEPTPAEPEPRPLAPPPPVDAGPPLPAALTAANSPMQSLWRALESVDGGDSDALGPILRPDGRWFPPGSVAESVSGSDLPRAMLPWTGPSVEIDVRRMIDLGGPFVAQVAVTEPPNRHELVLMVMPRGDGIGAIHHHGDPLGPIRLGSDPSEPMDLGPLGEVALERGKPNPDAIALVTDLTEALDGRKDDAARARLAETVVLHDIIARRTRRGRDAYLAGFQATMGDSGHLTIARSHSAAGWVVVEGAVHGREPSAENPQEFGFADVHRVIDGAIAETWHYVDRRGRPRSPRLDP
ncbi:nuclear transport factor 2 family protein [Paraliomyxa miuraensis]|uniref:nuclear transport factor 2 family protein n=1 Tax=Paraliomyxa miuraensis TaxID=376150 RepID=UPI0022500014|nr:nuclear transport factor 2 family protein [Paraliomyxa miuraensis]MCX4245989.1 nuclear transport factor 2 family protein [Paraliomyxa miuraensis]